MLWSRFGEKRGRLRRGEGGLVWWLMRLLL